MARLQDLENKGVAEHWFNKGLQIGSGGGNRPGEDGPYRPAPKEGDPDYTPPPKFPGQDVPKLQLAHGVTQDGRHVAPTETYTERTGAVQLPDGNWLMPTKDGKYRPASDEELLEIQYQFEHEHNPSGWDVQGDGWNQAMVDYGNPTNLDKLLGPHQGPGGSLRHMKDEDRKNLLIKGTKL